MYDAQLVEETVLRLVRTAVTTLPLDVVAALHKALEEETTEVAKVQLRTILENIKLSESEGLPMCQDTGVPIFFVAGPNEPSVEEGIIQGVSRATREVPLRPNVVDPIGRQNRGDNLGTDMPNIHFERSKGNFLEITYLPKGAGSENMSVLRMLNPSQGVEGIRDAVLDAVVKAEGKPCPPTIVGIGIGGTSDHALLLAKRALLRPLDVPNPDPMLAGLEKDLYEMLNRTGIGPMGLGGRTTVLGVRIEKAACPHRLLTSGDQSAMLGRTPLHGPHISRWQGQIPHGGIPVMLRTPISESDVRDLQLGEEVRLSGTAFTARDEAHLRALEMAHKGEDLPFKLEEMMVFHCGPIMEKQGEGWRLVAAGPTTSARMNDMEPEFIRRFRPRAIIGKGGMSRPTAEAMKEIGCVYLAFTGGAAVVAAKGITSVKGVHWYDLGMPEAVWEMEMNGFGPVIVAMDANGNSIYDQVAKDVSANLRTMRGH